MSSQSHLAPITQAFRRRSQQALALLLAVSALTTTIPAFARPVIVESPPPKAAADRWHAVLAAGDGSLEVWDHAVEAVAGGLANGGRIAGLDMFSAREDRIAQGFSRTSARDVLQAISALRPQPGEGCMVFITSHGAQNYGLVLSGNEGGITPTALDRALAAGCGSAPTMVIASGCYSGNFADEPMTRSNRVILTAARADRSSFGCAASSNMTVYDECLVASLHRAQTTAALANQVAGCVRQEEQRQGVGSASEPQAWFGSQSPVQLPPFGQQGQRYGAGSAESGNTPVGKIPPSANPGHRLQPGQVLRILKTVVDRFATEVSGPSR